MDNNLFPAIFVGISSFVVVSSFMQVRPQPTYSVDSRQKRTALYSTVGILLRSLTTGIHWCKLPPNVVQVYSMTITTLLLSFCLDEEKYKSGAYKEKLNERGDHDGRMFCVINNKQVRSVLPPALHAREHDRWLSNVERPSCTAYGCFTYYCEGSPEPSFFFDQKGAGRYDRRTHAATSTVDDRDRVR